ncbi:MAG: phage tail protein [Caulobacteraceae bacterium]|nr:phage tail protein [Caulobacteraceae bacterium]
MRKLDSLRAWLAGAIPDLKADTSRLQVFLDKGSIRSTGVRAASGAYGFEKAFTATLILTDFAGDDDAVFFALVAWAQANQPNLLENYDKNRPGSFTFEADILSADKVDLQIQLELTENVVATPRQGDGFNLAFPPEPAHVADEAWADGPANPPLIGSIWARGELIAEIPEA